MVSLPILHWPNPMLTQPATTVDGVTSGIRRLAAEMLDTMYAANGRGLAAPQVGVLQRLFVMDIAWKEAPAAPMVFVNPEIQWQSGVVAAGPEGCLSIPGPVTQVRRPQAIRLSWHDLDGQRLEARFAGIAAICVQHEIDHLDGILTLDHLTPEDRAVAEAEVRV
jgi:peptide deformylase